MRSVPVFVQSPPLGSDCRHWRGLVAPPQPNIASPAARFCAPQPCVAIVVACVPTADEIDGVHEVGPLSGAMYVVIRGSPRANHSAMMSNSPCENRGWLPFGIDTRFLNRPYASTHASPSLPNACLNVSWNQPRCAAAA